jgi:hypothetical protein
MTPSQSNPLNKASDSVTDPSTIGSLGRVLKGRKENQETPQFKELGYETCGEATRPNEMKPIQWELPLVTELFS